MESGVVGRQRAGVITVEKLEGACIELLEQVELMEQDLGAVSLSNMATTAEAIGPDTPARSGLNNRLNDVLSKIVMATRRLNEQRDILEF